jgi:integrase
MVGHIRTKESCPQCGGRFQGEPLSCPVCKTIPTRYFIHFWWKGERKLYSDEDGYPLSSWEQADRLLAHIRHEIDRDQKSKGKFRFDPKNYMRGDLNKLKFENYARTWLAWRAEELDLPDGISRGYLKSVESYLRNYLVPFFGAFNIREIHEGTIDDFRRQLPRHLRSKTVKNILGILAKVLQDAFGRREIERVPVFPKIKIEIPPIHWIDEGDQERILAEAAETEGPVFWAIFLFQMKQGCRPNEARALKWDRVDFRRNQVTINAAMDDGVFRERTKVRDTRLLPMHPRVREALESLPTRAISGFVFTYRGEPIAENYLNAVWRRVTRKLGLDISLYQGTKHSGASQAVNAGVDPKVIQLMLGHKDPRTTARYMEVRTDRLKSFWDRDHPQTIPGAKKKKAKLLEINKK